MTRARGGGARLRHLMALEPRGPRQLRRLVRGLFGIEVLDVARERGSTPPLAYLSHAFFEPGEGVGLSRDAVVWANRGGGKTMLGAVATLLDLIYKPGIEVRVLGGSLEQASKMYEHLSRLLDLPTMRGVLAAPPSARRVVLRNGSRVEVLAGSQRSVRGVRAHKLRCDEVEEFDPAVWEAAQRVTRSGRCGGRWVGGAVEALSTMHRPGGLMSGLTRNGERLEIPENENIRGTPVKSSGGGVKVFRWNAIDVVARCPPALACEGCELWDDCRGRAKHATGFVPVEDLLSQRGRSSRIAWEAEMMCRRPGVRHAVFPAFDERRHVAPFDQAESTSGSWVGGMDFGLRAPTVMLWACVDSDTLHVVSEYDATDRTLPEHLVWIKRQAEREAIPPAHDLAFVAIDPAGLARNAHSGHSDAALLRKAGYAVRARGQAIAPGIEAIRRRLDHATLRIDPRCTKLIAALRAYHFDPRNLHTQTPVKDGPDHWCDALRYLVTAWETNAPATTGSYL
ncbi:MAG: hypothetical protein AAGE65_06375 [Planctomycetota bacterium]